MRSIANPVDVRFSNISYNIPAPRAWHSYINPFANAPQPPTTILHNISGYVPAGQSLAILGPSGSGKTTLLNLLAARSQYPPVSGEILFGGAPRVPRTKRHIGYVMQDDVFFSKLTVRETLEFTASIRITKLSPEHRKSRVDAVMRSLRLTKCQNTHIGDQQFDKGISGGERKRVNIANELLHDPSVLLADECTSGLDSSSAFTVISLLRQLCHDGRTVIATIHQPSSQMFNLFDKIMLLAAGKVAYYGTPQAVVSYFEAIDFPFPERAYNPADYMLELVIDDEIKASEEDTDVETPPQFKSSQRAILEAWEAHGAELLAAEQHRERPRKRARKPPNKPSDEVVLDVSAVDISSSPARTPSSNSSTDDTPSTEDVMSTLPQDPLPPSTRIGRILRASKKRAYDFTGQHHRLKGPDKYPTGWFHQAVVLGRRALRQKRGILIEPVYITQVFCITILSALCWWQIEPREGTIEDRLGALSFFSVFWAFYSTFSALFAFPAEKRVLNKDRAGGSYRLSAYYVAKTMIETPADTIYPIFFSTVVYYAIGLNPQFRSFVLFTITLTLNVLAGQSIGLFISATVMDVRNAQVLASVWILASMLISGYYINPDNTPSFLMWLRALSFVKYTYEGLTRIEMLPPREFRCASGEEFETVYSQGLERPGCVIRSEEVLRGAEIEDSLGIAANIGVLIVWILVARLLGYFALKLLHTSHKPKSSSWKRS